MRAAKLDTPTELLILGADLQPQLLDWLWLGIRAKDAADTPAASGLRSPAKIEMRAWWDARLVQGCYLRSEGRLFHLDSARDVMGQQAELVMTATELIGESAEYRPQEQPPRPCRVHLTYSAPYLDDLGKVTDYRIRAEVAVIEVGRPQCDDQLVIGSVLYNVTAYADDSDDGVVRGLWLLPLA